MWRVAAGPVYETGDAAGGQCRKKVTWRVAVGDAVGGRCGKWVMWQVVAGSMRETGGGGFRAGNR